MNRQNGSRRKETQSAAVPDLRLNRLTQKSSLPSGAGAVSFNYSYNSANQRTYVTNADGSFWAWTYDNLGQVVSGKKYWRDGTPAAGQQFGYGFDDIGNRRTASRGGDQFGANLRQASYTVNNLNEINQRTVPGYVDVIGSANSNANVMVKGNWGALINWYGMASRKGEYFRAESTVDNSSSGAWLSLTSIAALPGGPNPDIQSNVVGNVYVPKTPEAFVYDLDGNLTSDGRWNYTWDAENRLVKMAVNTPIGPQLSLQFEYDSKGRRIRKQVWQNTTWTGTPSTDLRFVYDGWNLLASLNPQLSALNNFMWGLDLSGSVQGAGGVGGLLSEWDSSSINNQPSAHFAAFDGNGNVAALVNAGDGTISAQCEYGPFGEVIRSTGPMAKANPFRFSTKYQDSETDLIYYGYRYYSASTGRWLNRDPEEEGGGIGLCNYLQNDAPNQIDLLGLYSWTEASAVAKLKQVENDWRSKGWGFAAGLLNFFYTKQSSGPSFVLQGSASDAQKIKSNQRYRAVMSTELEKFANSSCRCSVGGTGMTGPASGHVDIYFFGGELFYALGNGHFDYNGIMSTYCSGGIASSWNWQGAVVQTDYYVFRPHSIGRLSPAYSAAYYLQTVWRYPNFWDKQEWQDSFGGGQ